MAKRLTRAAAKPRRSPRSICHEKNLKNAKMTAGISTPSKRNRIKHVKSSPNSTMEIISALSKQFLKEDKDVSFDNIDQSRSSRKDSLNCSLSRNSSYRLMSNDASFTSTPSHEDSAKSTDFYDFDEKDDAVRLRLELSPIKTAPSSSTRRRPKRKSDSTGAKQTPPSAKKLQNTKVTRSRKTPPSLNTRKLQNSAKLTGSAKHKRVEALKNSSAPIKKSTPINSPVEVKTISSKRLAKKNQLNTSSSQLDSGVFMTPASSDNELASNDNPNPTPTHTPANRKRTTSHRTDAKLHKSKKAKISKGLPDSPMLSPVQKVGSPSVGLQGVLVTSQSELFEDIDFSASEPPAQMILSEKQNKSEKNRPQTNNKDSKKAQEQEDKDDHDTSFKALDISKTYKDLGYGYFNKSVEKKKQKKTKKSKKRVSVSRYELVADKMNQEFDDLENFELSLD